MTLQSNSLALLGLLLALPLACDTAPEPKINFTLVYLPDDCPLKADKGDLVKFRYTGATYPDLMSLVHSDRAIPYTALSDKPITLGLRQGFPHLETALAGMCVGEQRTVVFPPPFAPTPHLLQMNITLVAITPSVFHMMDVNQDSELSLEEVRDWYVSNRSNLTHPVDRDYADKMFKQDDKNQDGKITWEEFTGPKGKSSHHKDEL